jgi:hypothetical protein
MLSNKSYFFPSVSGCEIKSKFRDPLGLYGRHDLQTLDHTLDRFVLQSRIFALYQTKDEQIYFIIRMVKSMTWILLTLFFEKEHNTVRI